MKKLIGEYKHYKGKTYEVLHIGLYEDNLKKCVVYRALYDISEFGEEFKQCPIFVREFDKFFSELEINSKIVKRFEKIE
jgi:hypothetical protein